MSTFRATTDAWVNEAHPSINHGQAAKLRLSNASAANEMAFIFFARPFPFGATVTEATLRVKLAGAWSGQTITARRVTAAWKENQLNWSNKPAKSDTNAVAITVTGADEDEKTFDLTDMLNDVSAGAPWFGIRLETNATTERKLYATEHPTAELRPQLDLVWVIAPEAPVGLTPGGGLAVSPAKPVLAWQFSRNDGGQSNDAEQASSQVQISTSASFTSPAYDSGMVANTDGSWDLGGTSYSLTDGLTYYWRVRVTDSAGQVSAYSETQSFLRASYGTLSLDNPDTGGVVDDLTPTIAWEFDATQVSWEIRLYRVGWGGVLRELYREPRTVSDDTLFTLPAGLIKSGLDYSVRLRVWDDVERIAIQGDPGYVEVDQDFTYSRDGGPDPVTALSATPDGARVVIAFTRSAMPDYFCLVVDGEEVDQRIDPTDVFVSGTSYELDYWGAIPRVASTYEVEAVVLGTSGWGGPGLLHSDGNATASATTSPIGIYFVDASDSAFVQLTGPDDDVALSIREVGTTYDVLGARAPVRILDALMGDAGSVTGHVGSAAERDTFLDLKGRLKPVRLIWGDRNILVEFEEVSARPTRLTGDRLYRLEASVFQIDAEETFAIAGG